MTEPRHEAAADRPLLEIVELRKHFGLGGVLFKRRQSVVKAVDGVTFDVSAGTTFGLVGESGSGKTTVAKVVLRLERPTDGRVLFDGRDVHSLRGANLRDFRRRTHAVFQDPTGSLSPRMRVRDIVGEPLKVQGGHSRRARADRIAEVLSVVGLNPEVGKRYPHEFSGGQRQRIAIARALAADSQLIVLDEPVSALDVSIRAQILNLLKDLQERFGLAYLMIAHDLAVVYHACEEIGVMYLGRLVERASSTDLYDHPLHPYSRSLIAAIPRPDPRQRARERVPLQGEIPSPLAPPPGCHFHPRCPNRHLSGALQRRRSSAKFSPDIGRRAIWPRRQFRSDDQRVSDGPTLRPRGGRCRQRTRPLRGKDARANSGPM